MMLMACWQSKIMITRALHMVHYISFNTNIHLIFSATITSPPSFKALPTFDIEFKVPCGVAVQDVAFRSSDTWT